MKPIVVLDTTSVHGRRPFARPDSVLLLELARTDRIRLVVPEVVLHELSRQWTVDWERVRDKLASARAEANRILADADIEEFPDVPTPTLDRTVFYDAAVDTLTRAGAEIPAYPAVPLAELLRRDLDVRKPFNADGQGFRDALIWATMKSVCTGTDSRAPLLFVTNNTNDFCDVQDKTRLHPELRNELAEADSIEVVQHLPALIEHPRIKPLAEYLRVVKRTFTESHVTQLICAALGDLEGAVPEPELDSFGRFDSEDRYTNPFRTLLRDAVFDRIFPDLTTIGFSVYRTGDDGELTISARVDADCTLEGFIDRSISDGNGYAYYEDWSRHTLRVIEHPRRARFTLSATFTEKTIDQVELAVDQVEEITLLTPLA